MNTIHALKDSLLYAGLPDIKHSISARILMVLCISEKVLYPQIYQQLRSRCEQEIFHQEHQYIYTSTQYIIDIAQITAQDIRQILQQEQDALFSSQGYFDRNKGNEHHIVPRQGEAGCDIRDYTIIPRYSNGWNSISTHYPLTTTICEQGIFQGVDELQNILYMTQKRHNQGLNIRYPGNMLLQHQIRSEIHVAPLHLKKIVEGTDSWEFIQTLLRSPIEEIYLPHTYTITPVE